MARRKNAHPYDRIEMSDAPVVRLANAGSLIVMVCVALLIGWMLVTQVDEIAKARGAVEPVSEVQRLQSEFGGAIESVRVERGEFVNEGDLMVVLDATEFASQLREARAEALSLQLERERNLALVEGREPDFQTIRSTVVRSELSVDVELGLGRELSLQEAIVDQVVARERAAFDARLALLENERQVIRRRTIGTRADIAAIEAERPALERQLAVAKEQVNTMGELVERKIAPRPQLVSAIEAEANYDYQLAQLSGRRAVLEAELAELGEHLEDVDLAENAAARQRITEINQALLALEEQIVRLLRRVRSTEVRAPVSGIVQSVPETIVGRVIDAGGLVAEIVPQNVSLRFAAELRPRDVGFVTAGQPVNLKIDAFDFSRYGALPGEVSEVSPTTIVSDEGVAYYEVLVDIPKPYFRDDPTRFALLPGMTGEVDILTGKKTVFEYVWKPIYTNLDLAFSER